MDSREGNALPFHFQFVAGAIAGVSEILVMYPLDVVKTRFQLQVGKGSGDLAYTSISDCFKKIIKNEGFGTLYRGILPPILVEAPKRAIKFAANEQYAKIYKDHLGMGDWAVLPVLTGMSAGMTEALVVTTPELLKIRLQDPRNRGRYNGSADLCRKIIAKEGILAMFKGFEATVLRHAVWNGGYFGSIGFIRDTLPKAESKNGELLRNFAAGTIGGTVGTTLNIPFDVAKTRIQGHTPDMGVARYRYAIPSIRLIAKEEGLGALYKGFTPKVLRLGPGGGILLVVFDKVSSFFRSNFM
ncbi:MAG: mitochondrial carrier domain-containing protein [Piptocephalis tieghemiana]|nr:MAG: mitochondrial carrier domain-containing protein [Piptocephalis tieghemiana]